MLGEISTHSLWNNRGGSAVLATPNRVWLFCRARVHPPWWAVVRYCLVQYEVFEVRGNAKSDPLKRLKPDRVSCLACCGWNTSELMPLPILSHKLVSFGRTAQNGELSYLRPDAKSQVTVIRWKTSTPCRYVKYSAWPLKAQWPIHQDVIQNCDSKRIFDGQTKLFINSVVLLSVVPAHLWLDGRKIIVDTYGG